MPPTATKPAVQTLPQDLHFAVAITKVDKDKRLVEGVATAEVLDSQGQIVDYETAKPVFEKWRGNIREMHQPVAVGKRVEMEFDDANKQILVKSYISKGAPETWEKVLDGTLSMYSIGARGVLKAEKAEGGKDVSRVFLTQMGELSLVDSGACPTSHFSIVKMDGEQPVDEQPADPAEAKPVGTADLKKMVLGTAGVGKQLLAAIAAGGLETDIKKRVEAYDIRNALSAISFLEELVASEMWDAQNAMMDGKAADPEGGAQLGMLKASAELLLAFLISEFMSQFEEAATTTTDAAATVENMTKAFGGVDFPAFALNVIKVGKRHSKNDEDLIQNMHDASLTLGAVCKAIEAKGDEEEETEETEEEKLAKAAAAAAPPAGDVPANQLNTPPAPAAVGGDERITKLEGELTASKTALAAAQETIQKQQESFTAVELRLKKLEDSPAPGGPLARVVPVQKTLGGAIGGAAGEGAGAAEAGPHDEILKSFDILAMSALDPDRKLELATQKLQYMTAHGLNAVDARSGRADQ